MAHDRGKLDWGFYRLVISKHVPKICALTNSAIFAQETWMVQREDGEGCDDEGDVEL